LKYFKIFQIPLAASQLMVFWTILKYHLWYYCQIPVQVMLLPIRISLAHGSMAEKGSYLVHVIGSVIIIITALVLVSTVFLL